MTTLPIVLPLSSSSWAVFMFGVEAVQQAIGDRSNLGVGGEFRDGAQDLGLALDPVAIQTLGEDDLRVDGDRLEEERAQIAQAGDVRSRQVPERAKDGSNPAEMLTGAPGRQDHVDGPNPGVLQLRGDITGMVDDQVGAHRHAPFPGFAAGRRRDDLGAGARFQELDRHRADGASAADDQDALHRLRKQILLAEHRFPRR
jgi:hypothetical protein